MSPDSPNKSIDYKSFFDHAVEGIFRTSPEGKLLLVNSALARICGYKSPERMMKQLSDITKQVYVQPGRRDEFIKLIQEHKSIHNFESEIYRKDGSRIWISENVWSIYQGEKIVYFEGTVQDITDKKRLQEEREKVIQETAARKAAEKAEKRFRTIFEQTPFSMQIFDTKGVMLTANRAWEKLWGFPKEAAIHKYNILKDPQLKEKGSIPYIKKAFKGTFAEIPAIKYEMEKTVPKVESTLIRWVKAYIYPITDEQDNIEQIVLMHHDITNRKTSEDELKYQKSVLEAQKEASPDGVLVVSPEGRIISYNQRFADMWGFPDTVLASKLDETALQAAKKQLINPDMFLKRVQTVYHSPKKSRDRLHFKDGRIFDRYGSPIRGTDKTYYGYVWFFRDITAEVQMEKRKDDFISIASHELKTPLTSVKAFSQLLKRYLSSKNDSKGIEYISKMGRQLSRLTTLIDDLLDISKIESGKLVLDKKIMPFYKIIQETVSEVSPTIPSHSIHVEGKTDAKVLADEFRISQVVTNFLTNAVKYSPAADAVNVHIYTEDNHVYCSVQDFGVGIPKSQLSKVFDRFYRVERRTRNSYPGLGLGLYISAQIIKRHGGKIWAESKKEKGTTFSFSLPIAD